MIIGQLQKLRKVRKMGGLPLREDIHLLGIGLLILTLMGIHFMLRTLILIKE